MKIYKSALEIGDVVQLNDWHWVGLDPENKWKAEAGLQLIVIDKHKYGFDAKTKDGKTICWLKDTCITYIGKAFKDQSK